MGHLYISVDQTQTQILLPLLLIADWIVCCCCSINKLCEFVFQCRYVLLQLKVFSVFSCCCAPTVWQARLYRYMPIVAQGQLCWLGHSVVAHPAHSNDDLRYLPTTHATPESGDITVDTSVDTFGYRRLGEAYTSVCV